MARVRHMSMAKFAFAFFMAMAIASALLWALFGTGIASGVGEPDLSTLGVGKKQSSINTAEYSLSASEKLESAASSEGSQLTQAAKRSVSAAESKPVVELAAVDLGDPNTVKAAAKIGVLNPPASAERTKIDTSGEGWLVGEASGYDVNSSSTLTRSGRAFNDDCVTVAVPEGQEDLLGHPVIIVYDGMVVVATVTDTGGFAKYGRVLDLGGGVHKALGFEDIWDWGVREVHYKFL